MWFLSSNSFEFSLFLLGYGGGVTISCSAVVCTDEVVRSLVILFSVSLTGFCNIGGRWVCF